MTEEEASGSETNAYAFDFLGQRVYRDQISGPTLTDYIYDEDGHVIAEHNGSTTAVNLEYVWVDDLPVEMIDSTSGTATPYAIHTGQIDEPLALTNSSGALAWNAYVDPYGTATTFSAPSETINLRLPGQWQQNALSQNHWREYDPTLGRFIETDPVGLISGQNPHAYVDGDPLNAADPLGLRPPTPKELRFIRRFFGPCLPFANKIDIENIAAVDLSGAAFSNGAGLMLFPQWYFPNMDTSQSLSLDNITIASIFGHEVLHYWQGRNGVNVVLSSLPLQIERGLPFFADPYDYAYSPDPSIMLSTFLNGNVEQQGQMFQDYIALVLKGKNYSAFSAIGDYVKHHCECVK